MRERLPNADPPIKNLQMAYDFKNTTVCKLFSTCLHLRKKRKWPQITIMDHKLVESCAQRGAVGSEERQSFLSGNILHGYNAPNTNQCTVC